MSEPLLVRAAARNNAEWCDSLLPHAWHRRSVTRRLLVQSRTHTSVLSGRGDASSGGRGRGASRIDASEGCSVKDSFAELDLATAGFRPLFRAEWLVRDPPEPGRASERHWSPLTSEEQLQEWEAAWAESPAGAGFFRRALLADEAISVLAGRNGDRIVAGAVANRSATVIGLCNVFDTTGDLDSAWLSGAAAATARGGRMPIVSYESGPSLDTAHEAGYRAWANSSCG